jgi:hypothetical protein
MNDDRPPETDVERVKWQGFDKAYADASLYVAGRGIGEMYRGMRDDGMSRLDALYIMAAYVRGLAQQPRDEKQPD